MFAIQISSVTVITKNTFDSLSAIRRDLTQSA
jgi:hypothetical protein